MADSWKPEDEDDFTVEEPELAVDDPMRAFLPTSFGKKTKEANIEEQMNRTKRPTEKVEDRNHAVESRGRIPDSGGNSDQDDSDGDDSDESDDEDEYPISHELILKTHDRPITTVSLDSAGSRLITGSNDCTIKLHDFASMTPTTLRAFKSVDPTAGKASQNSETHPINHVEFNPLSGGSLLVVPATSQAKVFSRDGEVLTEFVKGDMYLRDMHNTKGHVSEITMGTWNPQDRNICVTAGTDSTLRIWDVNMRRSQKSMIVHKSRAAGSAGRTRMTSVVWASTLQGGSDVLVAAALDGSLVMYPGNGPYSRPAAEIRDAHVKDTWTGGIDISADGRTVVTRGGDDTIKCESTIRSTCLISCPNVC
jgi:WD repeat-containing protein 70